MTEKTPTAEDGVYWIRLRGSLPIIAEWNGENWYVIGDWRELSHDDVQVISDKLEPPSIADDGVDQGDSSEVNEWVDITMLASTHHTQLNVCTGEIRHRRPGARYELVGSPPQMTAVDDDWMPGHPPD